MYQFNDLRTERVVLEKHVPCPVTGCSVQVERQKRMFQRLEPFKCHKHDIYISPSTFEYESYESNLLSTAQDDIDLLERILRKNVKAGWGGGASEDAVTWNVFRYLEKSGLLKDYLDSISRSGNEDARIIYWSYDSKSGGAVRAAGPRAGRSSGKKRPRAPSRILSSRQTAISTSSKPNWIQVTRQIQVIRTIRRNTKQAATIGSTRCSNQGWILKRWPMRKVSTN